MTWRLDELAYAGREHLDAECVAAYDRKSPTDWSEDIAILQTLGIGATSVVVDLGAGRIAMCERGIEAVHAGFLDYEHAGDRPHAVFTRNALRHLPDFWKAIALERIAQLLPPGGVLRLRDLVYSFAPGEAEAAVAAWLAGVTDDPGSGWTAEQLAEHVREEHSTFTWRLEPMLENAGFEILARQLGATRTLAAYTCLRR